MIRSLPDRYLQIPEPVGSFRGEADAAGKRLSDDLTTLPVSMFLCRVVRSRLVFRASETLPAESGSRGD